jgi:tRNA pseudouridine55 synthase
MKKKINRRDIDGVLLLDKPLEISSSRAALIIKGIFKANKAGHTGSLDVLASGLLPVCLGQATKFSQVLLDADKRYYTVAKLGERTETCDSEGEVIQQSDAKRITLEQINTVLKKFTGAQTQIPSMYSALKHNGQPLYKLARQGIEVERKPRDIVIHELINLGYDQATQELKLEVACSKGTYIRNLVDDIGVELGCFAYVKELRRLGTGPFHLNESVTIEQLDKMQEAGESIDELLLPVDSLLQHLDVINLSAEQAGLLKNGIKQTGFESLRDADNPQQLFRAYCQEQFLGVVEFTEDGLLKAKRLLATG